MNQALRVFLSIAVASCACAVQARDSAAGVETPRAMLGAPQLLQGFEYAAPLRFDDFRPGPGAGKAKQRFEGVLELQGEAHGGSIRIYKDDYAVASGADAASRHLPEFSFELVQVGQALVPVRRGLVVTQHPQWQWLVEPGRVWQEAGDGGYSRALLPFSLQERNANCTHNGVMTFLYRSDGTVSRVAYQVSSETCAYFEADLWGILPAHFAPGKVPRRTQVIAAYRYEVGGRMPHKPIAALAHDYPGVVPENFGSPADIPREHMTTWGVVVDGVHYSGGCPTRAGEYPFCEVVDLPTYSVAKSIFASAALMYLERKTPGVRKAAVASLVPECAASGKWAGVTLEHLLDMASGVYGSPESNADEAAPAAIDKFFIAELHRQKIGFACNFSVRQQGPGERFVYRTFDTYILGTALNAWTHRSNADVFADVVVPEIYRPLGLSPAARSTARTLDGIQQPFTGYGLTLHPDDVAKLGEYFNPAHLDRNHLLDPDMLKAALQLEPADRGLVSRPGSTLRYNNGFWALQAAGLPGCTTSLYVPFMSGFGGIGIVLMPNGVTYYFFSDQDEHGFRRALDESAKIHAFCQPARTAAIN